MTDFVPSNAGLDWGIVSSSSELPNVTDAAIQSSDLIIGARCVTMSPFALWICQVPTLDNATWVQLALD